MRLLAILLLVLLPLAAAAETRYLEVDVTLRRGQGTEFGIVRLVPTGTPVEVLEGRPESGYTRVRAPDGSEGWVLSRYLTAEPAGLEALAAARGRVAELERELAALGAERERLAREQEETAGELARIRDLSAGSLALEQENQRLKATVARQASEIEAHRAERETLTSRAYREWFLVGAGVLLAGIVLGYVLPKLRWRRRRSWSDL